jgi:hypothetical protein
MVQRHGANAFRAVEAKLEKMRRDGVNDDHWVVGVGLLVRSLKSSESLTTLSCALSREPHHLAATPGARYR